MDERPKHFELVGVKISSGKDGFLLIDLGFNMSINPYSVQRENIRIDGKIAGSDTVYRFSKDGHLVRFIVKNAKECENIEISGICSYMNVCMENVSLCNVKSDCFYRYKRNEKKWMKE